MELSAKFINMHLHELRTPITIVSSKLQSLLTVPNNTISDEVETIADAMNEIKQLKKMIKDLLSLSKEDAIINLKIERININELLEEIYRDYSDIALIQNKKLIYEDNLKNLEVRSDKNKLKQLFLIFIDNAFKYTNKNDQIILRLNEKDNTVICEIQR